MNTRTLTLEISSHFSHYAYSGKYCICIPFPCKQRLVHYTFVCICIPFPCKQRPVHYTFVCICMPFPCKWRLIQVTVVGPPSAVPVKHQQGALYDACVTRQSDICKASFLWKWHVTNKKRYLLHGELYCLPPCLYPNNCIRDLFPHYPTGLQTWMKENRKSYTDHKSVRGQFGNRAEPRILKIEKKKHFAFVWMQSITGRTACAVTFYVAIDLGDEKSGRKIALGGHRLDCLFCEAANPLFYKRQQAAASSPDRDPPHPYRSCFCCALLDLQRRRHKAVIRTRGKGWIHCSCRTPQICTAVLGHARTWTVGM